MQDKNENSLYNFRFMNIFAPHASQTHASFSLPPYQIIRQSALAEALICKHYLQERKALL